MSEKKHVLSSDSSERIFGKHSGFQNIREGSKLSTTTKKLELNLINVGPAGGGI